MGFEGVAIDFPQRINMPGVNWTAPGWYTSGTPPTVSLVGGRIFYTPIFVPTQQSYDRAGFFLLTNAAIGTVDVRLFSWLNGLPDSLVAILMSGVDVTAGASVQKEAVIALTLSRGYYFIAFRFEGIGGEVRGLDASTSVPPVDGNNPNVSALDYVIGYVDAALADPAPAPVGVISPSFSPIAMLREA